MRRKQEAGPGRSSSGPASSPLFTQVRRIGILGSPRAAWAETEARVAGPRFGAWGPPLRRLPGGGRLCWGGPVAEAYHTRREGRRGDEFQPHGADVLEDPWPGRPQVGAHREPDLVDEAVGHELTGQFAGTGDDQVAAVFVLEAAHALREVAFEQGGVPLQWSAQRPGRDVLGHTVHLLRVGLEPGKVGHPWPDRGQAFVGLAA